MNEVIQANLAVENKTLTFEIEYINRDFLTYGRYIAKSGFTIIVKSDPKYDEILKLKANAAIINLATVEPDENNYSSTHFNFNSPQEALEKMSVLRDALYEWSNERYTVRNSGQLSQRVSLTKNKFRDKVNFVEQKLGYTLMRIKNRISLKVYNIEGLPDNYEEFIASNGFKITHTDDNDHKNLLDSAIAVIPREYEYSQTSTNIVFEYSYSNDKLAFYNWNRLRVALLEFEDFAFSKRSSQSKETPFYETLYLL